MNEGIPRNTFYDNHDTLFYLVKLHQFLSISCGLCKESSKLVSFLLWSWFWYREMFFFPLIYDWVFLIWCKSKCLKLGNYRFSAWDSVSVQDSILFWLQSQWWVRISLTDPLTEIWMSFFKKFVGLCLETDLIGSANKIVLF